MLNFEPVSFRDINFFVIPKHFLTIEYIDKRKPLSSNAKRFGWIGCNILIGEIPLSGCIYFIKNQEIEKKENIINRWNNTLFLKEKENLKGWTLEIMKCIDKIETEEFSLKDVCKFEYYLTTKYPNNKHIKDKIRQQLQYLRDKGYLTYVNNNGKYRKSTMKMITTSKALIVITGLMNCLSIGLGCQLENNYF